MIQERNTLEISFLMFMFIFCGKVSLFLTKLGQTGFGPYLSFLAEKRLIRFGGCQLAQLKNEQTEKTLEFVSFETTSKLCNHHPFSPREKKHLKRRTLHNKCLVFYYHTYRNHTYRISVSLRKCSNTLEQVCPYESAQTHCSTVICPTKFTYIL